MATSPKTIGTEKPGTFTITVTVPKSTYLRITRDKKTVADAWLDLETMMSHADVATRGTVFGLRKKCANFAALKSGATAGEIYAAFAAGIKALTAGTWNDKRGGGEALPAVVYSYRTVLIGNGFTDKEAKTVVDDATLAALCKANPKRAGRKITTAGVKGAARKMEEALAL